MLSSFATVDRSCTCKTREEEEEEEEDKRSRLETQALGREGDDIAHLCLEQFFFLLQ